MLIGVSTTCGSGWVVYELTSKKLEAKIPITILILTYVERY